MRLSARRFLIATVLAVAAHSSIGTVVSASDRSADAKQLSEMLRSPNVFKRIDALKAVYDSGVTDKSLFDEINQELLANYSVDPSNELRVEEVSWMCKALSTAGLADYKATLQEVSSRASSGKVRTYAKESLARVDWYAERNAILSKETEETRGLSPEVARLVNMLRSDHLNLKKEAARAITESSFREPRLYEVVQEELLSGVQENSVESEHVDTMSWLCKALAASGDTRYRETLVKVASVAVDGKLRKYAQQSIEVLR